MWKFSLLDIDNILRNPNHYFLLDMLHLWQFSLCIFFISSTCYFLIFTLTQILISAPPAPTLNP